MDDLLHALHQQMALISHSKASYNEVFAELTKSNYAITSWQNTLAKQFESNRAVLSGTSALLSQVQSISPVTSNFGDLSCIKASLASLISSINTNNSSLSKLFAENSALRTSIASIASQSSVTQLLSSLDTMCLLHTSLNSQYRLFHLEEASFGSRIAASNQFANNLISTFSKFTRSYRDLFEYVPQIPETHIPFVAKYSSAEYSLEIEVLEKISVDENEEEETLNGLPSVDDELATLDDKLLNLIKGARQSLTSDNPEKARHTITSLRELFTQVLHRLAPDDQVKVWSTNDDHFYNNRPTRRARLLYICRNFSCDPLNKFVERDVEAALTLVNALNAETHIVQSKLTECQLKAIVSRMESLVLYLLKVSQVD